MVIVAHESRKITEGLAEEPRPGEAWEPPRQGEAGLARYPGKHLLRRELAEVVFHPVAAFPV
jgi:hypothetical protein